MTEESSAAVVAARVAGRIARPATIEGLLWEIWLEGLPREDGAAISEHLPDAINDEIGRSIADESDRRMAAQHRGAITVASQHRVPELHSPADWIAALTRAGCHPQPRGRDRWVARCPAHADSDPSLSIGVGSRGQGLVHCFAGCRFVDIAAALRP